MVLYGESLEANNYLLFALGNILIHGKKILAFDSKNYVYKDNYSKKKITFVSIIKN